MVPRLAGSQATPMLQLGPSSPSLTALAEFLCSVPVPTDACWHPRDGSGGDGAAAGGDDGDDGD